MSGRLAAAYGVYDFHPITFRKRVFAMRSTGNNTAVDFHRDAAAVQALVGHQFGDGTAVGYRGQFAVEFDLHAVRQACGWEHRITRRAGIAEPPIRTSCRNNLVYVLACSARGRQAFTSWGWVPAVFETRNRVAMKRLFKVVLIVIGVLIVLLAAAAIVLPMVIDINDYKDKIESLVEQETGREFTLKGDLELSVFPWLGMEIGAASLANAQGFGDKPMLAFEHAQVSVRLLPLLSKRIEIGTVSLDGVRVRLAIDESGTSNWQSLVRALTAEPEQPDTAQKEPKPESQQTGEGGFAMPELTIGAIEISDAAVVYRDATAGTVYKLHNVNLSTGHLVLGEPFPLELGFTLDSNKPPMTVTTELSATIDANVADKLYQFSDVVLRVQASGQAIPGGEQQVRFTTHGQVDLQSGHLRIGKFTLQAVGVTATGKVDGSDILGAANFAGRLTVQQFNPRSVMRNLGIEPPATADGDVLASAGLDAQFEATLDSIKLDQILIQLDGSTLKGDAGVANFANPAIVFDMTLDHINVDRYLPPPAADTAADSEAKKATDAVESTPIGGVVISLEPLKAFDLNGHLTVGKLTVADLHINQAELAITAHDGVLRIRPLGAQLYNGNLHIESDVSAAGQVPSYAIQGKLNGLHLGPLLEDLIGQAKVSALANLALDLTAAGNTVEELKRSLSGSVSFSFKDGAFNGFDLSKILALARQQLLGDAANASADTNGKTPFSEFSATFTADDGVLKGGGLHLNTPYGQITGDGTFNLLTNQLDYTVKVAVPKDATGDVLEELAGYTIPIEISGNLLSPSYSLDLAGAIKTVAQQKLAEEKAELQKKVAEEKAELKRKAQKEVQEGKQKLRNELKEGLEDLFN